MWLQQRLKGKQFNQNTQTFDRNLLAIINKIKKCGYNKDLKEL
ncbi:hypothetical protein T11_7745 [Trichinella zimbabwensis]|uniref:Uncharacterized protein n=1 Tax=Trichinella zimbabwensis TaxID=268475 RepID=A0A0V1GD54_9BILA|nr:hypothetical protein T11_7745 [Trichinella zimbabwensis]